MGFVKSKRSVIFPNPGFQRQLLEFEKKLITSRRGTALIAETLPKNRQVVLSDASPLTFLQESLKKTRMTSQTKSTEGMYKAKYKNLRDAYEEFKVIRDGKKEVEPMQRSASTSLSRNKREHRRPHLLHQNHNGRYINILDVEDDLQPDEQTYNGESQLLINYRGKNKGPEAGSRESGGRMRLKTGVFRQEGQVKM